MTSSLLSYPLKYFSVGLSSCLHILIAIILFAQTYQHLTQQPPSLLEAPGSQEDIDVEFDDYEDISEDSPDSQTELEGPVPESPQIDAVETNEALDASQAVSEPLMPPDPVNDIVDPVAEHRAPAREAITQRLRNKQSQWKKNPSRVQSEQPRKATAARQLSNHFTNFIYQKQAEAGERLAKAGGTPETLNTVRSDYHRRVLGAVKAATNFFLKEYYATHDFTTPRIHVLFEIDNDGNLKDIKLEPSSGYQDLDTALRNFVRSARFPKKPELLTLINDDPYDFYILPLPVHKGENILKLVAQF